MALIDNQNKVIYWDEVNWYWLPYISKGPGNSSVFFEYKGKRHLVNSKDFAIEVLVNEGFTLAPLGNLGVTELSKGCFLFNGSVYYERGRSSLYSINSFFSKVFVKPYHTVRLKLQGVGVLTQRKVTDLFSPKETSIELQGKTYNNYAELSKEYNLPINSIYKGLSRGLSLEEVVTNYKPRNKEVKGHLGDSFDSIRDMCRFWNTTEHVYHQRVVAGMSVKDALTLPLKKGGNRYNRVYTDFKSNSFTTMKSMCDFHGVNISTLHRHMKDGKTLEEALKYLIENSKVYDHLGNSFSSYNSMAKHYNLKGITLRHRLKRGWSLEEALTKSTGEVKRYNN